MQLLSDTYLAQLQELHSRRDRPRGFGGKVKPLGMFIKFMDEWLPSTGLDYGCGKGTILEHLQNTYKDTVWQGYDPAVKKFKNIKLSKYDVVFSNDVLEHIEPQYVDNVLQHMNKLSNKYLWLRIDTEPARKILKDGRNAHICLESKEWWEEKIKQNIQAEIKYTGYKKGKFDIALQKENI